MKLRQEYQTTCTQFPLFDVTSAEITKCAFQVDLAYSVEFNLAIQVRKTFQILK